MQKKIILALIITSLLSISFVLAAGSSSGGSSSSSDNSPTTIPTTTGVSGVARCEDITTPKGRILCRFKLPESERENYNQKYNVVEEACRGRTGTINEEKCKALYSRLKKSNCYELDSAVDKKKCFLKESGININQGGTFRASPNEAKRSYVVTLLYELQEKIEKLQESGKITAEESASLVAKIVEIKQMILDGKARSEVVPKMQEFKNEYKSVITEGEQ